MPYDEEVEGRAELEFQAYIEQVIQNRSEEEEIMGIHICLINEECDGHKEWDYLREVNDKNFPSLITEECYEKAIAHPYGFDVGFRPSNINIIRNKVIETNWENKDRYLHLLDLIEKNTNYYLHFSW